jgi:hypothetical protein
MKLLLALFLAFAPPAEDPQTCVKGAEATDIIKTAQKLMQHNSRLSVPVENMLFPVTYCLELTDPESGKATVQCLWDGEPVKSAKTANSLANAHLLLPVNFVIDMSGMMKHHTGTNEIVAERDPQGNVQVCTVEPQELAQDGARGLTIWDAPVYPRD